MTEDELAQLETLHHSATAGPWYVRHLDDEVFSSAVAVSTVPDTGHCESMADGIWPGSEIVAATLIQRPAYVVPEDDLWDENAALIAALRNAAPELIRLAKLGLRAEATA